MTRLGALLVAVTLAGCAGAPAATPEPTPEPPPTLDERITDHVRTWGGQETQYRIILTLDDCENLGRLGLAQLEKLDRHGAEGPASTEWRQASGYLAAILERTDEIDCPDNIPVP